MAREPGKFLVRAQARLAAGPDTADADYEVVDDTSTDEAAVPNKWGWSLGVGSAISFLLIWFAIDRGTNTISIPGHWSWTPLLVVAAVIAIAALVFGFVKNPSWRSGVSGAASGAMSVKNFGYGVLALTAAGLLIYFVVASEHNYERNQASFEASRVHAQTASVDQTLQNVRRDPQFKRGDLKQVLAPTLPEDAQWYSRAITVHLSFEPDPQKASYAVVYEICGTHELVVEKYYGERSDMRELLHQPCRLRFVSLEDHSVIIRVQAD